MQLAGDVGLEGHGLRRPVFFVHPVGGNVMCYVALARHLGAGHPFYALQASGRSSERGIEKWRLTTFRKSRLVQPGGPYALGGWSFGGIVAFEMARQLLDQGQAVERSGSD